MIMLSSYVDDCLGGGSPEQVVRMKGERVSLGGEVYYTGTLAQILGPCGFKAKAYISSGDYGEGCGPEREEELQQFGGKVLGIPYSPVTDKLSLRLQPSLNSGKTRNKKVVVNLTTEELSNISQGTRPLTKRGALSFLMGTYDPLGLLSPLTIKGKILLQRLYGPDSKLEWDDPLPAEEIPAWLELLEMAMAMDPIEFERAVRPKFSVGEAWLVAMSDGSMAAYAYVIYIRWKVKEPNQLARYEVRLLVAKARVSPIHGTPLLEVRCRG